MAGTQKDDIQGTRRGLYRSRRWAIASIVLLHLVVMAALGEGSRVLARPRGRALRQDSGQVWGEPVNLSRSGAASKPVLFAGPDGTLQVFWWDQLDGVATARWDGEAWGAAVAIPIYTYEEVQGELTAVPVEVMPFLAVTVDGRVQALWLGEPDEDTGARPLLRSQLGVGGTTWSTPDTVTQSALIWHLEEDLSGILHLAYMQPRHSAASPSGVYYRRSTNGGVTWSAPELLYSSMYFRLLSTEQAHLEVAVGGEGQVYVTWDDPRLETAFYARSADGGLSWEEPQQMGDPEEGAKQSRVFFGQDGDALLLWATFQAAATCVLYQQRASAGEAPRRVLEELGGCPEEVMFLRTATGQVLLVMGSGGGLTLAAWDGSVDQWSEPKWLGVSFEDPELERQLYLESLRATLAGESLAVVGQGQDGDVWFLESQVSVLEWTFAPPSPWSEPVGLSQSEGLPGLPAVATDAEGRVHVLWSEVTAEGLPRDGLYYTGYSGTRWTQSVEVLRSPDGKAEQPALVAVGDQLHAVWCGGRSSEVLYSRAYVRDAYAPGGWSQPQPLPALGDVGGAPAIAIDLMGALHVVYAVPLNEGRGIYYTGSDDGGVTWSEVEVVFDAEAAGWAMVDHPSLAVDEFGTLHAAWVRAPLPGSDLSEGIYYSRSTGGSEALSQGLAWSEPVQVADGAYDWPRVGATFTGLVHLLWGEADGSLGWFHQWSADGGAGWTRPEHVGRFAGVRGPVGLTIDGAGMLHLIGVGEDDAGESALLYTTWDSSVALTTGNGQWGELESFRLASDISGEPGVAVALRSALGWLDVTFRGEVESEKGGARVDVLYTGRSVPVVEVTPVPVFTPRPTMTPTPGPTPMPTPTPRPAVDAEAPSPAPPSLSLGPVTLPLLSLWGILLAGLIVVVVVFLALGPLSARRQ
jgi:hypothetical protein